MVTFRPVEEIALKPLIKAAVISFALSLFTGCGSSFEWFPDAGTTSTPSTSSATNVPAAADNTAPVANAGRLQSMVINTLVTLDGSGSTDANGDTLTYSWSFKSRPTGSSSALSNATVVKPTFTPDVAGDYVVQLIVNDGKVSSAASTVTVTASVGNAAPVANAGPAQSVIVGTKVTLAGSVTDANVGDTVTYSWSLTSKPSGSSAALSSATDVRPTFTADVAGVYVVQLVVNDGKLDSVASTVTITASAGNAAPVANAGAAQSVAINALVTLDGSGSSDANGDTLTYSWALTSKPGGSSSALSSATAVKPTFTPDVLGDYVVQLIVNDGKVNSAPSTVTVTATNTGSITVTIQ